jgi:hypothetical protein
MKKIEIMEAYQKMLYLYRTAQDNDLFVDIEDMNPANTILATFYEQIPPNELDEENLSNIRNAYSLFIKRNKLYL